MKKIELEKKIKELEFELKKIYNSKTYRLLYIYKNFKNIIIDSCKKLLKLKYKYDKKNYFYLENGYFKKNKVLGITHSYWPGLLNATKNQCSKMVVAEKPIQNKKDVKLIIEIIKKTNIKKIAINGILDGCELLIKELFNNKYNFEVYLIWHGSFTQQTIEDHNYRFYKIEKYLNKFKKIGFIKPKMAEILNLAGIKNSFFIPNTFNISIAKLKNKEINYFHQNKKINIGIFGWYTWHKNNINQIIAASLIKDTQIFTMYFQENPLIKKLTYKKIKLIPFQKNNYDFIKFMKKNIDINLYVSLTECYPNLFLESLALNIPCIIGKFGEDIIFDEELKKFLVVKNPEDILEIKEKIENVIKNKKYIEEKISIFFNKLIKINNKKILEFFNTN